MEVWEYAILSSPKSLWTKHSSGVIAVSRTVDISSLIDEYTQLMTALQINWRVDMKYRNLIYWRIIQVRSHVMEIEYVRVFQENAKLCLAHYKFLYLDKSNSGY